MIIITVKTNNNNNTNTNTKINNNNNNNNNNTNIKKRQCGLNQPKCDQPPALHPLFNTDILYNEYTIKCIKESYKFRNSHSILTLNKSK